MLIEKHPWMERVLLILLAVVAGTSLVLAVLIRLGIL